MRICARCLNFKLRVAPLLLATAGFLADAVTAKERGPQVSNRPRVFISHDGWLGSEEKDDFQSLIHVLMYQDKIDIQGIAATASRWAGGQKIADTHNILDTYALDWEKLNARTAGFKTAAELKAISYQGAATVAPSAGYSTATASSSAIIKEAKEAAVAGEKLNVLVWGGPTDIAQALHDDPSIAPHIRLFTIYDQDPYATKYTKSNFLGKLDMWVDEMSTHILKMAELGAGQSG